jgi:hypothetical protein
MSDNDILGNRMVQKFLVNDFPRAVKALEKIAEELRKANETKPKENMVDIESILRKQGVKI